MTPDFKSYIDRLKKETSVGRDSEEMLEHVYNFLDANRGVLRALPSNSQLEQLRRQGALAGLVQFVAKQVEREIKGWEVRVKNEGRLQEFHVYVIEESFKYREELPRLLGWLIDGIRARRGDGA